MLGLQGMQLLMHRPHKVLFQDLVALFCWLGLVGLVWFDWFGLVLWFGLVVWFGGFGLICFGSIGSIQVDSIYHSQQTALCQMV